RRGPRVRPVGSRRVDAYSPYGALRGLEMIETPPIVCYGIAARGPHRTADYLGARQFRAGERRRRDRIHLCGSYRGARPDDRARGRTIDYIANPIGVDTIGPGIDFSPTTGAWADFQHSQGTKEVAWTNLTTCRR